MKVFEASQSPLFYRDNEKLARKKIGSTYFNYTENKNEVLP